VSDPLGAAADLSVPVQTRGDIDLGAMVSAGHLRLGGVVRHVGRPSFTGGSSGSDRYELNRQGRAGLALLSGRNGAPSAAVLAVDADLSRTDTAAGESRRIAVGAEGWLRGRGLGVRAGVSKNTVGNKAASTSVGLSLALRKSTYIDGVLVTGRDRSLNGWGVSLRVAH
jgi:hypothetical protein